MFSMYLTEHEQQQFRTLARDFPKLWAHGKVTSKDRKALLRAAIEEVQLRKDGRSVNAKVHSGRVARLLRHQSPVSA